MDFTGHIVSTFSGDEEGDGDQASRAMDTSRPAGPKARDGQISPLLVPGGPLDFCFCWKTVLAKKAG